MLLKIRQNAGFTLLEVVIAIFIVAVMSAVVLPYLLGSGKTAQSAACEQNQRMIRGALTEYELMNHHYPTGNAEQQLQTLVDAKLLDSLPKEPDGGMYLISDDDPNKVEVNCSVHGQLGA